MRGRVQRLVAELGGDWQPAARYVSAGYARRMRNRWPGIEWRWWRDADGYCHVDARRRTTTEAA